jgi:hypothetical protein
MITNKLEELIHCGQATFKTFVAGGSNKHILNIEQDCYIVITDITYFSGLWLKQNELNDLDKIIQRGFNTQVTILGNKGFNRFVFRNNFNLAQASEKLDPDQPKTIHVPNGHCKIDTYLIHTDAVSFTFSNGIGFGSFAAAIANSELPAYNAPLDYGKDGLTNSLPSISNMNYFEFVPPLAWSFDAQNLNLSPVAAGNYFTKEFAYPITGVTTMDTAESLEQYAAPLLHVNYVEIKGLPNNINSK